jgi:peptidoglycan/xylan/chitin deacetylase (PgdA/CDA1 family)
MDFRTPFRIAFALLFGTLLAGQSVVLTFDDGPNLDATPKLSAGERNQRLLDAFKAKGVRVALFANGVRGGDSPEGYRWLAAWGAAGHRIGNHSYSHLNLKEIGLDAYLEDIQKLDRLIKPIPGYWRMYRFPFLEEGRDPTEWRRIQEELHRMGYRDAPVSVSTYDWWYNAKLYDLLKVKPDADIAPIRDIYLKHIQACLSGYRNLGRELLGRDAAQVILLHHNLLNALVMPDLLDMIERDGWKIVGPEEGYKDPLYQEERSEVGYAESILEAVALKRGTLLDRFDVLKAKLWGELEPAAVYAP